MNDELPESGEGKGKLPRRKGGEREIKAGFMDNPNASITGGGKRDTPNTLIKK